jgi:hypothetical protein
MKHTVQPSQHLRCPSCGSLYDTGSTHGKAFECVVCGAWLQATERVPGSGYAFLIERWAAKLIRKL